TQLLRVGPLALRRSRLRICFRSRTPAYGRSGRTTRFDSVLGESRGVSITHRGDVALLVNDYFGLSCKPERNTSCATAKTCHGERPMRADRSWVQRNLGFDPITSPPPPTTFATGPVARVEDFQREIIDFDSASPAGLQFLAFTTATGLSRYID